MDIDPKDAELPEHASCECEWLKTVFDPGIWTSSSEIVRQAFDRKAAIDEWAKQLEAGHIVFIGDHPIRIVINQTLPEGVIKLVNADGKTALIATNIEADASADKD